MPLTHLADLEPLARDMAERSLAWQDRQWDASVGLFCRPDGALYEAGQAGAAVHLVRETAWYALGLLLRNADGDVVRAVRAVDALLEAVMGSTVDQVLREAKQPVLICR